MSCKDNETCSNTVFQSASVSIPISLTPDVKVGNIRTKCCGTPTLTLRQDDCSRCEITITQTVTYEIPIEYGVKSDIGSILSQCKKINNICKECE